MQVGIPKSIRRNLFKNKRRNDIGGNASRFRKRGEHRGWRKSLALDIVEEFRQPLADRLVLKIFNHQMLTIQDFEFVDGSVILTEDGFRSFFRAYEKWMNGSDSTSGVDSFRIVIRKQVDKLKKAVQNGTAYEPFVWEE